jgi:UDPglucose 6-dehydrogenase
LFPGAGYGGSCFPKDVRALVKMADELGIAPRMLRAVDEVNHAQKLVLIDKIKAHFGGELRGKTIAVWGLAFKPRTDDIREAPALVLIDWLLAQGAKVQVHDPEAMENVRLQYHGHPQFDKLIYAAKPMKALDGADALAIMTEWGDYQRPEFAEMKKRMRAAVVFDGRNLYEPEFMASSGFVYYSIGRPAVGK